MKKRILHIIPSLDRAGAEKQMTLLVGGLPREAFEVHVCALTRGGPRQLELEAAGIPVTVIGKRFKVDPLAAWRLQRYVNRLRPDLVHTWLFAANARVPTPWPRVDRVHPIIVDPVRVRYWRPARWLRRWLKRVRRRPAGRQRRSPA